MIPTLGCKEAIFSLRAGRRRRGRQARHGCVHRAGVPGVRARRALRAARPLRAAAARGERLPPRSRRGRRRDVGADRGLLGQLPEQPDRRDCAARVLRAARRRSRASTASCSPPTRRTPSSGSTSRPSSALQVADRTNVVVFNTLSQALVDDGLPLAASSAGDPELIARAEGVPADRRHGAAGVRPARVRRRVGRRGARRARRVRATGASGRSCSTSSGGRGSASPGARRRCTSGSRFPTARRRRRSPSGCSSTASSSHRARIFGAAGEGYFRVALVPSEESAAERSRSSRRCCEPRARERSSRRSTAASVACRAGRRRLGVDVEAKEAILEYFRLRKVEPMRSGRSRTRTRSR